ncbi:hypothetical protein LDENG_00190590 [Lucifuga dentata]|nr:hypothetical protein LDENG_00190590 [Lucifuga dentata]
MAEARVKRWYTTEEALGEILCHSDVEIEDSSDDSEEEESVSASMDTVHNEEMTDRDEEYLPSTKKSAPVAASSSRHHPHSSTSDPLPSSAQRRKPRSRQRNLEAEEEKWHTAEEPDVVPPQPNFELKHPPGPRVDSKQSWTPLSLFKLFF